MDHLIELKPDGYIVNYAQKFTTEMGKRAAQQALLPAVGKQAMEPTNRGKDANLLWFNASFVLGWPGGRFMASASKACSGVDRVISSTGAPASLEPCRRRAQRPATRHG